MNDHNSADYLKSVCGRAVSQYSTQYLSWLIMFLEVRFSVPPPRVGLLELRLFWSWLCLTTWLSLPHLCYLLVMSGITNWLSLGFGWDTHLVISWLCLGSLLGYFLVIAGIITWLSLGYVWDHYLVISWLSLGSLLGYVLVMAGITNWLSVVCQGSPLISRAWGNGHCSEQWASE